jgi:hypothetical protein
MIPEILIAEVESMLKALRLTYRKTNIIKDISQQFICDTFGVVISVTTSADYTFVRDAVVAKIPLFDFRHVFITNLSNILEARQNLIWALAEGGYLKYVRLNFPRQFTDLITMHDFGNKIIDERLVRWGNKPKYKFLIDEAMQAKRMSSTMILSAEPSFFDYMPEKEGGIYNVF